MIPPFLLKYGLYAAAVLALLGALGWMHHSVRQAGYDERDTECKAADAESRMKAQAAADKAEMLMGQISIAQAVLAAEKSRKREIQYVEVTKWRTKYEKNPDAGKCVLPDEFVRVLDATGADRSGVSEETSSGSGADALSGRLSDLEVLQYSTDAKMMCLKWRDKLIWWQERERAISAAEIN